MTRDEMRSILLLRRQLSGETFVDETVDAWLSSLNRWTETQVRSAVALACAEHARVNVFHVHDRLPKKGAGVPSSARELACHRCDGTGWVQCTDDRRSHSRDCYTPDTCACSSVIPCACDHGRIVLDDPHTSRYPSLERGRQIMADAYADECRRLGREPLTATYERLRGFDPATLPDT